jgi:methoxymalonate biosynthesis acyl carrier protein
MENEIRKKLRDYVLRSAHFQVKDDDDIFSMGFVNSLFAMQLVLFVEREFGISIDNDDLAIDNFKTIDAITRLVEHKIESRPDAQDHA